MQKTRKKILVALSGGVDSSVAALILKQKGYEVIAAFMNFWSEEQNNLCYNKCCSLESARRARAIARKLKIKLYSLNYKELFRKKVVEDYIQGHKNNQTPNPCVICNREIKFGRLLNLAQNLKCSKLATGHYARIIKNGQKFELFRGIDEKKDQSYFLWQIPRSSLSKIILPIGSIRKSEVRKKAKKYHLSTHNKKDSQGLCFISHSNSSFLKKYSQNRLKAGDVVDKKNNIIGRHQGLELYTIGQRAGFLITKYHSSPLYVIKLDAKKNNLVVGENKDTFFRSMVVSNLNWLASPKKNLLAQIRYQHKPAESTLFKINQNRITTIRLNRLQHV